MYQKSSSKSKISLPKLKLPQSKDAIKSHSPLNSGIQYNLNHESYSQIIDKHKNQYNFISSRVDFIDDKNNKKLNFRKYRIINSLKNINLNKESPSKIITKKTPAKIVKLVVRVLFPENHLSNQPQYIPFTHKINYSKNKTTQ